MKSRHRTGRQGRGPLDGVELKTVEGPAAHCWKKVVQAGSQTEVDSILRGSADWVDYFNRRVDREISAIPRKRGRGRHWIDTPIATGLLRAYRHDKTPQRLKMKLRDLFIEANVPFARWLGEGELARLQLPMDDRLSPETTLTAKLYHGIGTERKSGGYSISEIGEVLGLSENLVVSRLSRAADVALHTVGRDVSVEGLRVRDDIRYFENALDRRLFPSNREREEFMEDYRLFAASGDLNSFIHERFADAGGKLRFLRLVNAITQGELGERVGVKRDTIYKYEGGVLDGITQENILKHARNVTSVARKLGSLLLKLGYREGVSMFLWNKQVPQVLEDWGVTALGSRMRAVRVLAGKTTTEVAKDAKVGRRQVESYEKRGLDVVNSKELCKDYTQVVKTIKAAQKVLCVIAGVENASLPKSLYGKTGLELVNEWGITHQGHRLRVMRRLAGKGLKEFAKEAEVSDSTLEEYEHSKVILGPDLGKAHTSESMTVKALNKVIGKLDCDSGVCEVLFQRDTSEVASEISKTASGKVRAYRVLKGWSVEELAAKSEVPADTIYDYERGDIEQLTRDNILKAHTMYVRMVKNLGSIIQKLDFKGGVCTFIWDKKPAEVVAGWKLKAPKDKLRALRILSGESMREVESGVGLSNTALIAYETALGEVPLSDVYSGGRSLLPLTVANLKLLCKRYKVDGGVSGLLWDKPAYKLVHAGESLGDRLRFALTLAGHAPAEHITLLRYLDRNSVNEVGEVEGFWGSRLQVVHDTCVEGGSIRGWRDLFPGGREPELRAAIKGMSAGR